MILGASGDLTARLLLPGLARLVEQGLTHPGLRVAGAGKEELTSEKFQGKIRDALAEHASNVSEASRERLVAALSYRQADVTSPDSVAAVLGSGADPLLVYLALPPGLFEPTIEALAAAGMPDGSAVALEKPFGSGLASARQLNGLLERRLPGTLIYRVDHFLSDELVENVLAIRSTNRVFEPILNSTHVERVDISWNETLALEGRAVYYDTAGALRDMIQSHLLQVLALLTMDLPARGEARPFRDARANLLASIPTPDEAWIRANSVRGRYAAGTIGGRSIPAYVDEPGVDPERGTETYAELTLAVDSWRWAGVPVTLRSGKALSNDRAEIAIHFKEVPGRSGRPPVAANVLRIGLMEPSLRLEVAVLGSNRQIVPSALEISSMQTERPAYANLLLDMLRGNPAFTVRGDEAEEAWRIIEPVIDAWRAGVVPLLEYPAGSDGPGTRGGSDR